MVVGPISKQNSYESLFHEYVHYLVSTTSTMRYAQWYNEGIADFFSTLVIEDDFIYIGRVPESRAAVLQREGLLNLETLFAITNYRKESQPNQKAILSVVLVGYAFFCPRCAQWIPKLL